MLNCFIANPILLLYSHHFEKERKKFTVNAVSSQITTNTPSLRTQKAQSRKKMLLKRNFLHEAIFYKKGYTDTITDKSRFFTRHPQRA